MTAVAAEPRCRFGGHAPATVRAELSAGCVCFPDDREQFLCEQHWHQMEPLGDAKVVEELATQTCLSSAGVLDELDTETLLPVPYPVSAPRHNDAEATATRRTRPGTGQAADTHEGEAHGQ